MESLTTYLQESIQFTQPESLNEQHTCNCPLKTRQGNCYHYANYEIVTAFENTRIVTCKMHLKANLLKLEFPGLARVYYRHIPFNRQILSPIPTYCFPNKQMFDTRMMIKLSGINTDWTGHLLRIQEIIQPIFETNRRPLAEQERLLQEARQRSEENRRRLEAQRQQATLNTPKIVHAIKIRDPQVIKDTDCPICYDSLDLSTSIKLKKCSHIFHMKCIQNMLNYRLHDCPLCRCCMLAQAN